MAFNFSRINSQLFGTPASSQNGQQDDFLENSQPDVDLEEELPCGQQLLEDRPSSPPNEQARITAELLKIDPGKKLSIWMLDDIDLEDCLVKQYCELVIKHKPPVIPSLEEIAKFKDKVEPLTCSVETQSSIIILITSYFQTSYFIRNMQEAVSRDITLFNPNLNFFIPGYTNLPLFYFKKLKSHKTDLVLALQTDAARAALFSAERYLLLAIDKLSHDLGENMPNVGRYELAVLFEASRKNFKNCFKIKNFNWDEKKGMVHESFTHWRKQANPVPPEVKNKYAEKLASSVKTGKLKLSAMAMNSTINTFFDTQKDIANTTKHKPKPKFKSTRVGVKNQHRVEKDDRKDSSRTYNPGFNRGRQLDNNNDL